MIVFIIVLIIMLTFMGLEYMYPRYKLPCKKGWFLRATIFNFVQLGITLLGTYTWEHAIYGYKGFFQLTEKGYTPFVGGLIAYLINTWIFYWWHRARHEINWMWLIFHQFHHSPERIETITSFYKHPLEIFANSLIMSTLMYPILGLSLEANIWLSIFSAFGEFFYHMNIKTPYWLGFIIQRPESHRLHHLQNARRCKSYADIPLWDILGGTFENPKEDVCLTGFSKNKETNIVDMMMFKNVINPRMNMKFNKYTILSFTLLYFLLFVGLLSSIGYIFNAPVIRGIGLATVASPLPLVFSTYNGIETFSTTYNVTVSFINGGNTQLILDNSIYNKLLGPYNRRNMYGVTMSHGPFFDQENMITALI